VKAVSAPRGERIRVAYFSDALYVGGAEKYLFLLASHLDRDEFDPVLIVNRGTGLEKLAAWAAAASIPVYDVSLPPPFSTRGAGELMRLVRRLRPALFHCNLPGPWNSQYSLVAPLAKLAGARRVLSTEHLPMAPPFAKGAILKRLGTLAIDRVITVSRDNVGHLTRLHGVPTRKIRVVYNGVPEPIAAPASGLRTALGLGAEAFVALIVGSLEERKGHETAFEAWGRLSDRAHLVVIGTGPMEDEYRHRVRVLGLESRVHFMGQRDDVPSILKAADVLVVASTLEATPYVIIEAMAAGLPVVASDIYGIPEIVERGATGLLVPPANPEALAGAVRSLGDQPALRQSMGEAGHSRFEERFTIERSVADTVAVYRELAG
jgi:glycosyltransferase involved in cell wall biosynthesis